MRIGIDASPFRFPNRRGVANNIYRVLENWTKNYPENEYYLLASAPIYLDLELQKNWHIVETKEKYNPFLWYLKVAPEIIKGLNLDVFWGTDYLLPARVKNVRYYVSIYDMTDFIFWSEVPIKRLIKNGLLCKGGCKRAERIITISRSTQKDIGRIFKISPKKIFVSYLGGVENAGLKKYDEDQVRPELKCADSFLFISGFEPRKNIHTIVKAFEWYKRKYKGDEKLILAGSHDYKAEKVLAYIEASEYRDSIIVPGYINEDEKDYLFTNAICLLYPSLYEGFGIPILEGFDYGLPVITTAVSSMPEVGGDAAFYIKNPKGTKELASVMHKVRQLNAKQLAACQVKMKKQAERFSWEKNAGEIMKVLKTH